MGNTAQLLILFFVFWMVTLLWFQAFKVTTEEGVVLTSIVIMLGTFFFGILGNTYTVYYLMFFLALCGVLAFVFNISVVSSPKIKLKKRMIDFFSPGMMILCLIFLYSVISFRRAIYTYPDEYFQWGTSIKYMFQTKQLPYGEAFTGEDVTFSIASMFQYFWTGLSLYVESNTFTGNFLLAFIPILLPFSGSGWKKWKEIFIYTFFVFLALNLLSYIKYYNLLQDFIIPLWAGGIITWIIWKRGKNLNWVIIGGSICVISAMKSLVGPLCAVMICIVLVIRQWVYFEIKNLKKLFQWRILLKIGYLMICILGIGSIWSKIISQNVLNRVNTAGNIEKNFEVIFEEMLKKVFDVTTSSVKTMPYVSYIGFFFICFVVILLYTRILKNTIQTKIFKIVMPLYLIGFIGYFLVMLYAYCYIFGVADSMIAAGLERYLSYYTLLGVVPMLFPLFSPDGVKEKKLGLIVTLLLSIILVTATGNDFLTKISVINKEDDEEYQKRCKIEHFREQINALTGGKGKIFLMGDISSNEAKMITYELGERLIWNKDCYSMYLRQPSESKVYVDVITYPELLKEYGYDYIWFYNGNTKMEQYNRFKIYYHLGNVNVGDLYRIVDNEQFCLEYIGNVLEEEETNDEN